MKKTTFTLFVITISLFLHSCDTNGGTVGVEIKETAAEISEVTKETIRLNNCGGKANAEQVAEKSKSINLEGAGKLGVDGQVVQGEISAKYGNVTGFSKSQKLTAPASTNMEFILQWTEKSWVGVVTTQNSLGEEKYKVSVPISVELISSRDLGCSSASIPPPTLTSTVAVTATLPDAPKWFRLRNKWNPYCLASVGNSKSIGNPVAMGDCESSNSLWQWDGQEIHNAWNPYCLGSKGDSEKLDNPVIMEECGKANTFWQWDGAEIRNKLNPYYLGSIGPSKLIDNPVVMGACCQANAYWYIETVP